MGSELLPNPIIFGPNQPQLRLKLVNGRQIMYSQSNFNLYLEAIHLAKVWGSDKETLTFSSLLHTKQYPSYHLPIPKEFQLPSCNSCNKEQPCRMLVDSVQELRNGSLTLRRVDIRTTTDLDRCPILAALFNCMQSEAERTFARLYYQWALNNEISTYKEFAELWCKEQVKLKPYNRDPQRLTEVLTRHFTAPALLPQVWLNYTYNAGMKSQTMSQISSKSMSRVDFLMFVENERHIIEIDGPSHYARFNSEAQRYEVDEELYAKNLRVQRELTSDGWHTHRFGRWELTHDKDILWELTLEVGLPAGWPAFEYSKFDMSELLDEMEKEAQHFPYYKEHL